MITVNKEALSEATRELQFNETMGAWPNTSVTMPSLAVAPQALQKLVAEKESLAELPMPRHWMRTFFMVHHCLEKQHNEEALARLEVGKSAEALILLGWRAAATMMPGSRSAAVSGLPRWIAARHSCRGSS